MKKAFIFLAAAISSQFATAQVYTEPVGYVSVGDTTAGQSAIKATTDVAVSVPLHRASEYAGTVSATTATTITLSGTPGWTTNQWAVAGSPYLVTVTSGAEEGFTGLISSNTSSQLTVMPVTLGNLLNVTNTDTIKIHPAWTLITLFPSGTFPTGVRLLAFSGTAGGINLAPDLIYVWTGTKWTKSGVDSNNDILYTGESFIIRTLSTAVTTLTIAGEVPSSKSRAVINKITAGLGQDTRIAYVSPVDEIIGNSGLSSALTIGDRLLGFNNNAAGTNKAPTDILVWTGTKWTLSGVDVTSTYLIKAGQGYIVRRLASAAVGDTDWVDKPIYQP